MFQSFDVISQPQSAKRRVDALRETFDIFSLDAFLVPRGDEYQGEHVPACAERLAWLTGFTGSAGAALITRSQAVIFVDGRYITQMAEQTDPSVFARGDLVNEPPARWIENHAPHGFRLGIDPWLHGAAEVRRLEKAVTEKGGELVFVPYNPLDRLWHDRPAAPDGAISPHAIAYAGTTPQSKIFEIAEGLQKRDLRAVLIADPSSVAWIFNIRGNDVPHTPHPLSRALIYADGQAALFVDGSKLDEAAAAHLRPLCAILPLSDLESALTKVAENGGEILVDPEVAAYAFTRLIREAGGEVVEGDDPARLPRAVKNDVEIKGATAAHLQDGAAMVNFLYWLSLASSGVITEIDAVQQLEQCRARMGERMQNQLKDISFDTIAGAGEHGAIMHYRVNQQSNRRIGEGELFLIDSGAQYLNGTTDITRTVGIGAVPEEQKRFFTLVLKGMIAISMARFPQGTRGCDLDPLARSALWRAGADYGHGTGHGVGSYLSVHEGPQRISRLSTQELLPGMILSNEPGYYRPGQFGIRIENLVYVREAEDIKGGDTPMRGFETLTYCPIDRDLVLPDLLTQDERQWFNDYHAQTCALLMPLIDDAKVKAWLEAATQPL